MEDLAKALTWTFIHSLWLGLLAALLSAVIISCTRNAPARLRYNLLGMVMILFFASSIITFIIQWYSKANVATVSFTDTGGKMAIDNAGLMDRFIAWVNVNSDIVMLVWLFFFLFSFLKLVTGLAGVNRLKHYKAHPVTAGWKEKLEQLQLVIGVRHSVALLQSEMVKVPMALGIFKPVILLPLGLLTNLPPEQVETILLHELAHIRRKDYLVNLLQHIVEAIFFFNPAIRWISFLVRQEREACCDDLVLANCTQKTNYLNALINFQEYSIGYGSTYAMGISGKRHYLLNRVTRMITNKNKGINFIEKIALLAGVLFITGFSFITKKTDLASEPNKIQQSMVLPVVIDPTGNESINQDTIKRLNKAVTDTVPVKKKPARSSKKIIAGKPPAQPAQPTASVAANAKLQEIIKMKDHIGDRKERIGVLKEKIKTADEKEKEKIEKDLKRERDELQEKRKELDQKREQWDELKEKAKEEQLKKRKPDVKEVSDQQKKPMIKNNKADQPDKSDEYDKSDQWDKSAQWDKSDQWDGNASKKSIAKTVPAATGYKPKIIEPGNYKVKLQEFEYKMSLPTKIAPPVKQALEGKIIKPRTPAKKARPVRT